MRKNAIVILKLAVFFLLPLSGFSNSGSLSSISKVDTIPARDYLAYKEQMERLDSLYLAWYSRQLPVLTVMDSSEFIRQPEIVPELEDSVYALRLKKIPSAVELTYNKHVKSYIDLYSKKRRASRKKPGPARTESGFRCCAGPQCR